MFCQICGSRIPEGRSSCTQCGAPAGGRGLSMTFSSSSANLSTEVRSCPRCGYQGPSGAYFSTTPHLLTLIAAAVMFAPAAFVYFALRYSYRVCPSCGEGWGKHAMLALQPGSEHATTGSQVPMELAAMSDGGGKRGFSWVLFVLAAILIVAGIANFAAPPIMFGMLFGGGGYLLRRAGNEDRMRRREAILQSLQRPVVQLAAQRGGTLTVTEVAAEFGWSIPRAEKVLQSLEDGYRVMGDVTSEGVIVYNFLELVPVPPLAPPLASGALPTPVPAERPAGGAAGADSTLG